MTLKVRIHRRPRRVYGLFIAFATLLFTFAAGAPAARAATAGWWSGDLIVTQAFGCTSYAAEPVEPWRGCPSSAGHFHDGVDIGMRCGTPLVAPVSMRVIAVGGPETGLGPYYLTLRLPDGHDVLLGHVQSPVVVSAGATVSAGQVIAYSGTLGNSSGCHLHFEVRPGGGAWGTSVDPTPHLNIALIGNGGGMVRGSGSGRCLDVTGGSNQNGARIQLYDCLNSPNQQWVVDGLQLKVYANDTKCLDADSTGAGANGTRVQIWTCLGTPNQQWVAGSTGILRSVANGLCLDATGFGTANGTPLQLWACAGGSNQTFTGQRTPNGGGRVRGTGSGRCLDVMGGSISPGAKTQLWDCSGVAQQQWIYASGQFKVYGDKCLDVEGAQTRNGARVQVWYCSGAAQQQWTWNPDGTIRSQLSGRCLDATGLGTGNGVTLQIWDCTGRSNQQWTR